MNFIKGRLENKKGFTLVELLIVIAVLGIIAGIGVNSMTGVTSTFKDKADQETARMLAEQIEIKVLAGTLSSTADGTVVTGEIPAADIPKPQSGTAFVLTLDNTSNNLGVDVTITGNDDFSMDTIDIADKAVE